MSHVAAQDGRRACAALHTGIEEAHVAAFSAEYTEEAGVVLSAVGREVAYYVAPSIEVDAVLIVVLLGVELLPVVSRHIDVGPEHEVDHLLLDQYVVHVVELCGAHDDIGVVA